LVLFPRSPLPRPAPRAPPFLASTILTNCRIQNPLAHLSVEEVTHDVTLFAEQYGFQDDLELLTKGALVAKDPVAFESVPGITEEEKHAIRNEVLHKWRQPRLLYFTIVLCSIGAAVQGW
jgi:hypothetical protein